MEDTFDQNMLIGASQQQLATEKIDQQLWAEITLRLIDAQV